MDKKYFDECLLYYGLDDFFNKRNKIKECFIEKDIDNQYLYKLYVYSRPFIKEMWKDYIWDYLQGDIDDLYFASEYLQYKRKSRED